MALSCLLRTTFCSPQQNSVIFPILYWPSLFDQGVCLWVRYWPLNSSHFESDLLFFLVLNQTCFQPKSLGTLTCIIKKWKTVSYKNSAFTKIAIWNFKYIHEWLQITILQFVMHSNKSFLCYNWNVLQMYREKMQCLCKLHVRLLRSQKHVTCTSEC